MSLLPPIRYSSDLESFQPDDADPLGETYYSVTPFRYGDHVAKLAMVPVLLDLTAQTGTIVDASGRPDAIRETVRSEMRAMDGMWEVRVQLCRDLDKQPIEDPTVEWKEADSPFQTGVTIHAGPQDSWNEEQVRAVDEAMRFSVWVGIEDHRPLGDINRARKTPYEHSADFAPVSIDARSTSRQAENESRRVLGPRLEEELRSAR